MKNDIKERLLKSSAGHQWQKLHIRDHHGVVIPLFSLHSQLSCGIGEYPDLLPLIDWCSQIHFDIIQLLPLNDTGLESSPYSALSAFALNPVHLGLASLPHINENDDFKKELQDLQALTRQTQRIDYKTIHLKKDNFLRAYYSLYGASIINSDAYRTFKQKQRFWLFDYAIFKALKIYHNWQSWEEWPESYRQPSQEFFARIPSNIAADADYHIFLQFLCFQQLEKAYRYADKQKIYLKGDVPILINRDSADVWRNPQFFKLEFAAGAPPDMYSEEGQKWGFPLYNWKALEQDHYHWWIKRLEVASQFYHLYRIDHVVGFFRIWAIPHGCTAKEGHYIPQEKHTWMHQGETIMKVMLASCPMLPIGEDLGNVPNEVRQCLRSLGICGTKVMRWERHWETDKSFIDPKSYIPESMTTVSTHDSDTLILWWKNSPDEAKDYAWFMGWSYTPELPKEQHFAILHTSHHSGSLFHINLLQEYLALVPGMTWPNPEDERVNFPGTISDNNWSYRFVPSLEEISGSKELEILMKQVLTTR